MINASSHSFLNFGWYSTLVPVILLCGVMFYCCIFFPESPRWLLAMKTPTGACNSARYSGVIHVDVVRLL